MRRPYGSSRAWSRGGFHQALSDFNGFSWSWILSHAACLPGVAFSQDHICSYSEL
jgi:hypothetical protein